MTAADTQALPLILAGPMVRHVSQNEATLWLVTSERVEVSLSLFDQHNNLLFDGDLTAPELNVVPVGERAFITTIHKSVSSALPENARILYDIRLKRRESGPVSITELLPELTYPGQSLPGFTVPKKLTNVLHGSCRKPHHPSDDGLLRVDQRIEQGLSDEARMPDMLIMSGDQIYTDDVAGPTLSAIHQVIEILGLYHESIQGSDIISSKELLDHEHSYYERPQLLPDDDAIEGFYKKFFKAKTKPIFTSVNANNHLISLAEVIAMYLLVWSPSLWRSVKLSSKCVASQYQPLFEEEQNIIETFVDGLPTIQRALANIPVYMIFDDHDITDDWNLTRGWEEAAYGHPFGKRIIGNALVGYWLCQGWGNQPAVMAELAEECAVHFSDSGIVEHDKLVDRLLDWQHWGYYLDTTPKVVVLDTRTQRWRSESSLDKPSGLMDWEALCDVQQELIGQQSVIMVSAAPVFGVKLIEVIQRIFTFFGKALTVDAENWMAHKGTASVMLNIFRHKRTPPHFVILSGDVHYNFIYDITLRFRRNSPQITQVTSSGIKNEFPDRLIRFFDKVNQVLYHRRSPLNWFTRRRNMKIRPRYPDGDRFRTLYNSSGLGELKIGRHCRSVEGTVLRSDGEDIRFMRKDDES